MDWFNVLMTEFIVACVAGYYLSQSTSLFCFLPIPYPFRRLLRKAKFIVVSGRKDGVDLVLIYRHVVIFGARFG